MVTQYRLFGLGGILGLLICGFDVPVTAQALSAEREDPRQPTSIGLNELASSNTTEILVAQGLSSPELDDALSDLRATFTEIEAITVPSFAVSSPGYTIVNPAGYGSGFGSAYIAAGGVFERRFDDQGQAGVGVGFGLGDPASYVGMDVSYVLADLDEGIGGFSFKVHRNLVNTSKLGWAVGVGWEDFVTTGEPSRDSSVYGSTSVILKLNPDISQSFSRLALTVGVGGGRFRSEDDILEGNGTVGVFGSAAVRVTRSVSVIGEWTGQDLAAGVSVAPFPEINFFITPALRDLVGAGDDPRVSVSTGLSFNF